MGDPTNSELAVLETWKHERNELDALITALEKRIALRSGSSAASTPNSGKIGPDDFFRMSTPDAVKKFLKIAGKPARSTTDIIDSLKSGGLATNYTNVYTALTRLEKKGEIVKVGENWGLDVWYPPASAREAKAANGKENSEEDDENIKAQLEQFFSEEDGGKNEKG